MRAKANREERKVEYEEREIFQAVGERSSDLHF